MTDDDKPIEYKETVEESDDGKTVRRTRIPTTSDNKDGQDDETAKESPKVFAASGKQRVEKHVEQQFAAKRRVEAKSHQDTSEDDSTDE